MRRKEGKGSRQRAGHPFPFSLAFLLVSLWMIPRSRQLQQLSNSHLAHPPWFTTPHRWHRVCLRPLTNHLHCALFLEILGCMQAKISQAMQAPPTISVCGTRNGGSFSAQVQLYPKPSIPMLERPLYSVSLPLLHTGFTRHTSKYRHTTSTYPHSFFIRTHASFIAVTL